MNMEQQRNSKSASPQAKTQAGLPNCLKCVYFKITWDSYFPRACEIFGIKCQSLPSQEVFKATGSNCPSFSLKPGLK